MKKIKLFIMILMPLLCVSTIFTACSKDYEGMSGQKQEQEQEQGQGQGQEPEETSVYQKAVEDIVVTVDADGKADGGHSFNRINQESFQIDGIIYTSKNGYLEVTGYNSTYMSWTPIIISQLKYDNKILKVNKIGNGAFENCTLLYSIMIPSCITDIGERAFYKCKNMMAIIIGEGLMHIDSHAFAACTSLSDFYCYTKIVPDIIAKEKDIFEYTNIYDATLYVPYESVAKYKKTYPWSGFEYVQGDRFVKEISVTPVFGPMTQNPNPVKAGQDVTLTFSQEHKGNGLAGTTYEWTIKNIVRDATTQRLKDTLLTVHTNYDGNGKADPTLTFRIPENCAAGSYTVEMGADFSCYIGSVLYDMARASGQLKVQ